METERKRRYTESVVVDERFAVLHVDGRAVAAVRSRLPIDFGIGRARRDAGVGAVVVVRRDAVVLAALVLGHDRGGHCDRDCDDDDRCEEAKQDDLLGL